LGPGPAGTAGATHVPVAELNEYNVPLTCLHTLHEVPDSHAKQLDGQDAHVELVLYWPLLQHAPCETMRGAVHCKQVVADVQLAQFDPQAEHGPVVLAAGQN